jgi:hypothetical protein
MTTPKNIPHGEAVLEMIKLAEIPHGSEVLDPCAGSSIIGVGSLAMAIARETTARVTCFERQEEKAERLRVSGFQVLQTDFLRLHHNNFPRKFDAVLMMMPKAGAADTLAEPGEIEVAYCYVSHAMGFVRPGGSIVAVIPDRFLIDDGTTEIDERIRRLVKARGELVGYVGFAEPQPLSLCIIKLKR